ncbi:MAG: hypothetical protein ACP5IC_00970 [Minisyncoccia bacterium]
MRTMEIGDLTKKLAEIREKITSIVERINTAANGEAFYARIFLTKDKHIIGLISDLRVNRHKIIFTLAEDKLVDGKIFRKVSKKEIEFEKIQRIELFRTISGKPLLIKSEEDEI